MSTRILRLIAWALLALIAFVTLSPIGLRPVVARTPDVERVAAFATLGGTFYLAYSRTPFRSLLGVVAIIAVLELMQTFVPGRHGQLIDGVVKASGAGAGAALAMLLDRRFRWSGRIGTQTRRTAP